MVMWLSTVLRVHAVFDTFANSPKQQNSYIAEMNISHRDLTLLYLYTK